MRVLTGRLLLVPIGPEHIEDLYRLHQDPWVAYWYGGAWTREEAAAFASSCAAGWRIDGVSKWVAYEKTTGSLVGRGGLSRLPASASSTKQIDALLADPEWRASRLEVGWAMLASFRRQGIATELGQAALSFATDKLSASRVIAFTEQHNQALPPSHGKTRPVPHRPNPRPRSSRRRSRDGRQRSLRRLRDVRSTLTEQEQGAGGKILRWPSEGVPAEICPVASIPASRP